MASAKAQQEQPTLPVWEIVTGWTQKQGKRKDKVFHFGSSDKTLLVDGGVRGQSKR